MDNNFAKQLRQHRCIVVRCLIRRIQRPEAESAALAETLKGLGRVVNERNTRIVKSFWKALAPDLDVLANLPEVELRSQLYQRYRNTLSVTDT